MKAKITILILLIFGFNAASLAQNFEDQRARLHQDLERTDELLNKAGEAVRESGSERALNQLEMAIQLQTMARELALQIDGSPINWNDMMNRAGRYTLSARDKAQRAIAITHQAAENEEYVQKQLEKTDDLIRRMEERVSSNAPEGLRQLLENARDKQQRAKEFFRNRRLKACLQMTLQVEKSLNEAADKAGGYEKARGRYQMQVERYLALEDRIVSNRAGSDSEVEQALKNAGRLRIQAENLANDGGRYERAEQVMQEAVETLTRVAENLREPAKVKAAIEDMKKMAMQLREQVEKYGDRDIRRQYQAAEEHLARAGELYERQDFEGAAAQLQAARQIMTRIADQVERPHLIENGLEILRARISRLETRVDASGNGSVQKEFAEAREILAKASALYKAGDYGGAASQLEIAERILARIEHTLGD